MGVIAKYKFNSSLCANYLPVFNVNFTGYTVSDINNGDNTITRTISHDTLKPTLMRFGTTSGVTDREKSLLEVIECDTSQLTSMISMFQHCSSLTSLDLSSFDTSKVNNMFAMFQGCTPLTLLNVSSFNTSQVTNMSKMFYGCNKLNSLDLSNFDTSNVTTMSYMFANCSSLTLLNVSSFNTGKATEMNWMFSNCGKLTSLDLSNFDTGKVKLMDNMFNGCGSLASLNVSSFNTGESTTMVSMFQSCKSLIVLDLSNFDTNKVTNMVSMFFGCSSLISLNISSFNTSQVIDMANMFQYCSALTSLDLSNFDTNKLTSMANMFNACNKLNSLDLSSFNTNSVTNMNAMFANCGKLTSLDLSNFDTSKVTDMNSMFGNCSLLSDIGLLYATSSTINSLLTPLTETNVARNIYYTDAPLNELTVQNNITYKEYKISSRATFPYTLNKLPNGVADYIDVVNKVHVQRVGVEVLDGSDDESWILYSDRDYTDWTTYQWRCSLSNDGLCFAYQGEELKSICDKLSFGIVGGDTEEDYEHYRSNGSTICTYVYVWLNKVKASTVSELKQYLQSNPITVLYELATPIYTPLTEEEIAQLPLSALADGYINLSSNQLTPSMDLRMRASNRYQVDMLEADSYYYLYAPVGNVKLGTANVNVAQMPCIIKVDNVGTGDSGYRLKTSAIDGFNITIPKSDMTDGGYYNTDGSFAENPGMCYSSIYYEISPNTMYGITAPTNMRIQLYTENQSFIKTVEGSNGWTSFTTTSDTKYFRFSHSIYSKKDYTLIANPITLAKLPSHRIPSSFTQGMKCATDFGYWEGVKESAWRGIRLSGESGEGSLRSADNDIRYLNRLTYGTTIVEDEFDFATGKLTKRIGKFTLTKEMVDNLQEGAYGCDSGETQYLYLFCKNTELPLKKSEKTILASIPLGTNGSSYPSDKVAPICLNLYMKDLWLFSFRDYKDLVTKENKKEYLARYLENNPMTIYYELETPEISYVDVLSHTGKTINGSTNMYTVYYISETYLQPQVKPSLLSYPTLLTPSTQYTVFHNRKNYNGSVKTPMIDLGGTQVPATGTRTLVTTPSTLAHNELRFIGGENTVEQVMVLHGDWTKDNKNIDYFEGMQSSIIGDKILENLVGDSIGVNVSTTKDIISINDAINDDKVHTKDGLFESAILSGCTLVNLTATNDINFTAAWQTKQLTTPTLVGGKKYIVVFNCDIANADLQLQDRNGTAFVSNIKVGFNAGINKNVITLSPTATGLQLRSGTTFNVITTKIMVLEYQEGMENWDIPYFESMQSVRMPILKTTGKNLFDYRSCSGQDVNVVEIENGLRVSTWALPLPFTHNLLPNTTYTSKSNVKIVEESVGVTDTGSGRILLYNGNIYLPFFAMNGGEYTFTTPSDIDSYDRIVFYAHGGGGSNVGIVEITNLQIEQGSTATPYEPYKSNILTTPEEVVLRSLPNGVCDTLNLTTGEYVQRIGEVTFDGSDDEIWSTTSISSGSVERFTIALDSMRIETNHNEYKHLVCDKYKNVSYWEIYNRNEINGVASWDNGKRISIRNGLTDLALFKADLQQNPVTIQYELETHIRKTVDLTSSGNWEKVVLDGDDNIALSLWDSNSNGTAPDVQGVYTTNSFTDAIPQAKVIASGIKADFLEISNYNNETCFMSGTQKINFNIFKDKLSSPTVEGVKEYLKSNPITVWYQTTSHKDSTQVKQPLLFKDGHIQLSSGGLLPNAELTVPTTNKYQLDLDRLKYTVITKQGFTFNGNDYPTSATGINIIDVMDVVDNALYSDDENITVVQENANSYEDGILTQFKGTKVFAKNFIDTTNSIKRSAMKMIEPLELQGIPGGAADTYDVLTGTVARRVNTLHFKDLAYRYSTINSGSYKKYVYSVYTYDSSILANKDKKYISNILPVKEMNVDSTERGFYFSSGNQLVVWQIGNEVDTLKQYLEENDFTVTYELTEPQIIKPDEMKPYVSTRPEKGSIESLDSKLQAEYLNYDNEQYILSPRMLGEGDTIRWEQGSQCYVFENDKEYIPLEDYREPFGFNLDAKDVEQYIENVEGAEVELGIPFKEKAVYEQAFNKYEDSVIYPSDLENIDETNGVEVDYICGATWQNPDDLSDIRHLGTLRDDGQYDVTIRRSGDDEIRLMDGTTHITLDGDGLEPSEFELTYFSSGGAELGKYGDTSHMLEDTVKDSKLESGMAYGDTLVNLLDTTLFWLSSSTVTRDNDGWITVPGSGSYVACRHKYQGNLKTDTLYTLIVDVKSNTCSGALYLIDKTGGGEAESAFTLYGYNIPSKATGRFVQTLTTKSDLSGVNCDVRGMLSAGAKAGESIVFRYMLIEGDHTSDSTSIPYFEGIGSTIVNGFTTTGKNMLPLSEYVDSYKYYDVDIRRDGDCFIINGTTPDTYDISLTTRYENYGQGIVLKKGKTYSITREVVEGSASGQVGLAYKAMTENNSILWWGENNSLTDVRTPTENVSISWIRLHGVGGKVTFNNFKVRIMIEESATATSYEPYKGITYTLPSPITLNSVNNKYDNVQDTFDLTTQIQTKNVAHMLLDGSHTLINNFNTDTERCYIIKLEEECAKLNRTLYKDDIFNIYTTSSSQTSVYCSVTKQSGMEDTYNAYASYLSQWLSSHPIDFLYKLYTVKTIKHTYVPSSTQATQEPTFILPQQLRSLPNGICDRLYWDDNKCHYCIEKRVYDYTITGANDVAMMDSGISSMIYAYGDTNITNKMLNLKDVNLGYIPAYSYNNKVGNKILDVVTSKSTIEAITPFNGRMYYRLSTSRVGTTINSFKSWFNENPTTVYLPLATPEIIDLPHLNHKLELPTQPDSLPIGYRVEHPKANPQLGLTIPTKVLNLPKQPVDLNFVMRDNQIGDYILTWSEIKEARQYNIILNDSVIATTKEPSYNTGEEIYGYILVEAQNELGENLSKELYVKTVPNAPAQLTVTHNPMTDSYDFDITFISTSAIADYYTIKYCVDDGDWVVHDIQATDIELDSKVLYQFSVFSIEDNIKVHATATNDIGTNDILPVATYYMSPTPQWTYRINSKEAFIRWIDNSPYDVKYKVRYSYLSEGVYKYAYFEGDTSEVGKMYELMLPLAEDDELTVSICIVSDKENLYCKPVKMSKSLDPNIVPPLNFKYRWLARGLIEFSWEDNYEVDVKYEYVLEHKLADADVWEAINEEIIAEDVAGIGTVYRLEYQLQDLEQIRVKVRMLWAMNETEWTETLATVFIPVEGNPPTWIKRTQTQEGLLVQWEAQAYVDSYHLYIVDAEGTVLQHIETLDDFILLDIDYDNPIELHIYEKTRFSGGIESDPTDEMVFTPTSYRTTHLMNIYKPCAEEYKLEVATIQKGSKETYVINDVTYTPNVKTTGDVVTSISSPFQISYHPLGIDVHQAGSKAYAPLDLSVRTLDVKNKYQFDIMTFERITDKYDMNFNVYTPSVMSYPITLEVSKVRIVCLGDSLTSGHPYYWAETGTGMVEASYPYQLSRRLKNQFEVINSGYGSDTTDRCLARFDRDVLRYKPQYCLFQCGTNDLYWAMAESLNNQEALDLKMAVVRDNTMEVVKRCWDNGIIPIIGTLIPRTGATGIYKTALFDHNKWIINWCNEQSAAGRDIFYVDFFNAGKDVTPPTPLEDPTNPGAMNPIYDGESLPSLNPLNCLNILRAS